MSKQPLLLNKYRVGFIALTLIIAALGLIWRVVDLKVVRHDFLKNQSNARVIRNLDISAHRGMILDRNGAPLAISTPVVTIWANPQEVELQNDQKIGQLAKLLGQKENSIRDKVSRKKNKEFVYLKRRVKPETGGQIKKLDIKGIYLQKEYRRYYPSAEVFGHVVGFTNIDEKGIEGLELLYDEWLSGIPGERRVLRDRLGQIIAIDENLRLPSPGKNLRLSMDRRIQYLAYYELKKAIKKHNAIGGSAVLMDIKSGEILAMVNQPGFNPNRLNDREPKRYKNRAVTDQFEPGSTVKPLTIMAALQTKRFSPDTMIETGTGWMMVGRKTIKDTHGYGTIDVSTVLQKSSNVGTSKIALKLPKDTLWDTFAEFGFGQDTGSTFPGEMFGRLVKPRRISKIEQATISFGYGVTSTALQLAQVYSTIARDGKIIPVSFLIQEQAVQEIGQVNINPKYIKRVRKMMERVVETGGTALQAAIPGYKVAGKTGTVKKVSQAGGYTEKNYLSVFAGIAPASKPRLAMAIMVDNPQNEAYYGGLVAGPVFSKVMAGALRLMNITPDNIHDKTKKHSLNTQIEAILQERDGLEQAAL